MSKSEIDGKTLTAIKCALLAYNLELCSYYAANEYRPEVREALLKRRDNKLVIVHELINVIKDLPDAPNPEAELAFG